MRGVKSFAMVLCVRSKLLQCARSSLTYFGAIQATSKDGKEAGIELIQPPAGSKPGDRVYFEGGDFESKHAFTILPYNQL